MTEHLVRRVQYVHITFATSVPLLHVRIVLLREPGAEAGASKSSLEGPGCVWVLERPECGLESTGSHKEESNLDLSIKIDPHHAKWF